jgi:hypothetical protein
MTTNLTLSSQQKKTRFQKAREEKELKKKLDEEEAAKLYDSFVDSFKDEDQNSKVFIRGGRVHGDGEVLGGKHGELYTLNRSRAISDVENSNDNIKVMYYFTTIA